jgi:hypothetical protein
MYILSIINGCAVHTLAAHFLERKYVHMYTYIYIYLWHAQPTSSSSRNELPDADIHICVCGTQTHIYDENACKNENMKTRVLVTLLVPHKDLGLHECHMAVPIGRRHTWECWCSRPVVNRKLSCRQQYDSSLHRANS